MRWKFTIILLGGMTCSCSALLAQTKATIRGTVYDAGGSYVIPNVQVYSVSGSQSFTDSAGAYQISVLEGDSIYFQYHGKNSITYAVADIYDRNSFDIAMHAEADSKYKVLQEVTVFSDTYKMDSLENRRRYAKIFESPQPGISVGMGPNQVPGIDIGSIVELFQFRKNKQRKSFYERLIQQEQEGYIDYRFSPDLVSRITGLKGKDLEDYRAIYRPDYEFVSESTLVEFYQYIIDSAKEFRKRFRIQ